MKNITILMISKKNLKKNVLLSAVTILSAYLLIALYFTNHCFPHTSINGADVSWEAHKDVPEDIGQYVSDYELLITERNNKTEVITGQEIGLICNNTITIRKILKKQNPLQWFGALFRNMDYREGDLFTYDESLLTARIEALECLNQDIVEPRNAAFLYTGGGFELVPEEYGTKTDKEILSREIRTAVINGIKLLDLDQKNCYINPEYTISMQKTLKTWNLLNRYVATRIRYRFGSRTEILDGGTIHEWLSADEDCNPVIDQTKVQQYVRELSGRYDTVGISRDFAASSGKKIEVKGGIYGWIIDQERETNEIITDVTSGGTVAREPVYSQRAISRELDDIGTTYVEISITRQHLWFYKAGKLVIQGSVVTGNPNRGTPTVTGTHMLNYKQENATLKGPGYEVTVKFFMPFYGSIGIHDAGWRYSFGGDIYLRRGTHGCVNAPLYLAKTIFENIEEGTPVVCYEE